MLLSLAFATLAQDPIPLATIVPRSWLVVAPVDNTGRRPFRPDHVFARHLLDRNAEPPKPGSSLRGETGADQAWEEKVAGEDGSLGGSIGWAYTRVESVSDRVALGKLTGASRLFVNGTAYGGDPYAYGYGGVPVALRAGGNDVYVSGVRGSFRLELSAPPNALVFGAFDTTKPDIVPDVDRQRAHLAAGVLLMNATNAPLPFLIVEARGEPPHSVPISSRTDEFVLPPLCVNKYPVPIWGEGRPKDGATSVPYSLVLHGGGERRVVSFDLAVRARASARQITYTSTIDGSVQRCAVMPPSDPECKDPKIVLSLHGAGVDCWSQITSYSQKRDFLIVAATNRRPFGFDWQDWGRIDAYEALSAATRDEKDLPATPMPLPRATCCAARVYLTGHSMGGHGTWHLAANDTDRFLAIAPSAGWASFDSYGGRPKGELADMWHAADGASNTLALVSNLVQLPTYILHGTADDNVPVTEARALHKALEDAGARPWTHYQEGAGHWWDDRTADGTDCLDWASFFNLFRSIEAPAPTPELDFMCVDPGVDARHHWIEVLQPIRYGEPSRITVRRSKDKGALAITTSNIRAFRAFQPVPELGERSRVSVDGRAHDRAVLDADHLWFEGGIQPLDAWKTRAASEKTPELSGPFKRAFDRRFVLVYGTHGDTNEDRELLERARHDLEVWWYRGNGGALIVTDDVFAAHSTHYAGRNVILYGNSDTNAAWKLLVKGPLQAQRGRIALGDHVFEGSNLGAVCVLPRADDAAALVGICADSGVVGTRLGYDLAPFVSGVGYPDYAVFDARILESGDGGVLTAGWFGADWKPDGREFVRR